MSRLTRLTLSEEGFVAAAPEIVFPLLCPVREYDWIEGWSCELVHSASGVAEQDCVFATDFPGQGRRVWMTIRHEPPVLTEFAVVGAEIAIRYPVRVAPAVQGGVAGCTVAWTQVMTALTATGQDWLAALDHAAWRREKLDLIHRLDHFCRTGSRLERKK